jgi:hypothetical protein
MRREILEMRGSEVAFRAQLVIPEQLELYDYWLESARGRRMPRRADIHPGHIPRLLPQISLIDVETDPVRYRVRLAGTRLYEVYGREITGNYVENLGWGDKAGYWMAAYRRVTSGARPAQGIVQAPLAGKDHLVQFWLRLPLSEDGAAVSMILSHDAFVPVSKAVRLSDLDRVGRGEFASHTAGW